MNFKTLPILCFASLGLLSPFAFSQTSMSTSEYQEALKIAETEGQVRIMVTLQSEPSLAAVLDAGGPPDHADDATLAANVRADFLQRLGDQSVTVVRAFDETPTLVLDVTPDALRKILQDEQVTSVTYLPAGMGAFSQ